MNKPLPSVRPGLALGLILALGACGGIESNRSLESIHQPVVERQQFALDLTASPNGLSEGERGHLLGWFEAMNLRYGDRVSVDDPLGSPMTREAVQQVASKFGLLVKLESPVTSGYVNGGTVRIVVTRSTASVPHCPDWSANSDTNLANATSSNYGCAVNSNLAVMVANPEDLLHGATATTQSNVHTTDKAVQIYEGKAPTGAGDLKVNSTKSGG